jgi:hypothetical protein
MNKLFFLSIIVFLVLSCSDEPEKNHLLDAKIDGQYYSFKGTAVKFTDYINNKKEAYEFQVYNHDRHSFLLEAYDTTFVKLNFSFPDFSAQYIVELDGGQSKTYQAVSGQFRILGTEQGNLRGDFSFKAKNILDVSDSVMITEGYFDIFLENHDRMFPK